MRVREGVNALQSRFRAPVLAGVGAMLAACALAAAAPAAVPVAANGKPIASAGIEQCVTSVVQAQRSATFVGEMTAVPGTVRMQMRIDVLERGAGEAHFHAVTYPGLGQWLRSSPGVKTFRNLSKVTDLSAPASYRGGVHFRWLGARGRLLRTLYLRSPRCQQPAAAPQREAGAAPLA
jgi:hypothetical protein